MDTYQAHYAHSARDTEEINEKQIKGHFIYWRGKEFLHGRLVKDLLAKQRIKTRKMDASIWLWDEANKHYIRDDARLHQLIAELAGPDATENQLRNVYTTIRAQTYDANVNPTTHVPLPNGHLNLATLEVEPVTPDRFYTFTINAAYDAEAKPELIQTFLDEVLPKKSQQIFLEFLAYTLFARDNRYQAALMCNGTGANGKSVALGLIQTLLRDSCAGMSLQEICESRFAACALIDKLVNIGPDMPSRPLQNTGTFKAITGGDQITVDRKFKEPVNAFISAKLVFACNELPRSPDENEGYYRRWLLLDFPIRISEEKRDKNLLTKLTTPRELSGLLNLALAAWKTLEARGRFDAPGGEEIKREYKLRSNPVAAWFLECVVVDVDGEVDKELAYRSYIAFCRSRMLPIRDLNWFIRLLIEEAGGLVYSSRITVDKTRIYVLKGIRLSEKGIVDMSQKAASNEKCLGSPGIDFDNKIKKQDILYDVTQENKATQSSQSGHFSKLKEYGVSNNIIIEKCPDRSDYLTTQENDINTLNGYIKEMCRNPFPSNRQRVVYEVANALRISLEEVEKEVARLLSVGDLNEPRAGWLKTKT